MQYLHVCLHSAVCLLDAHCKVTFATLQRLQSFEVLQAEVDHLREPAISWVTCYEELLDYLTSVLLVDFPPLKEIKQFLLAEQPVLISIHSAELLSDLVNQRHLCG